MLDPLPLSALQHLLFCERQAMLIHVEQLWAENRLTAEGRQLHKRAHSNTSGWKDGVYVTRALSVASQRLGLSGKTDVVEFTPPTPPGPNPPPPTFTAVDAAAASTPGGAPPLTLADGAIADSLVGWAVPITIAELATAGSPRVAPLASWKITPVEYKRGKPKKDDSDRVQLCAQAICLEEMLGVQIPAGALFYGQRRRRTEVPFTADLRAKTAAAAARLRELFSAGITPPARREPKCDSCSLLNLCLPDALARSRATETFIANAFHRHLATPGPTTDELT